MIKITAFDVKKYELEELEAYAKLPNLLLTLCEKPLSKDTIHLAEGAIGVCTMVSSRITPEIVTELQKMGVKHYATRTVGYDHVDLSALEKAGISASHAKYPATNLAEFTILLILMHLKKMKSYILNHLEGDYSLDELRSTELKTKTVGVIGAGNIGLEVINLLKGFGCRILVNDIYKNDKSLNYVDLDTLYAESDIITLHVAATKENYQMINKQSIKKMLKKPLLVNIARGEVVDTLACLDALDKGELSGLYTDVIEGEGEVIWKKNSGELPNMYKRLQKHKNALHTPHYAFFSDLAIEGMVGAGIKGIINEVEGKENPFRIK
ncbi:MAG: lactate dehydrogenase [Firmicutes bacterium]|nr:lactate dehydrogenase [Bacillota bacterium]